jgi:hypothetical protein
MPIFGKRGEVSWSLRPEGGGMIQVAPLAECHRLAEERGEGTTHLFADHDGAHTRASASAAAERGIWRRGVERRDFGLWLRGGVASHAGMPAAVVRSFQRS